MLQEILGNYGMDKQQEIQQLFCVQNDGNGRKFLIMCREIIAVSSEIQKKYALWAEPLLKLTRTIFKYSFRTAQ